MSLQIFFPMGGQGKRFVDVGYLTPKPLLELGNKKLIRWALEPTLGLEGKYHFLPTLDLALNPDIFGVLPPGCWHVIMEPTPGPLQTMLEAEGCLMGDEEILICDCDSFLDKTELENAITLFRNSGASGGVTIRRTQDPGCSYAEISREWQVLATREKDVFSSWSTTGPYWFRSAKQFYFAAKKAASAHQTSISPVYNFLPGVTRAVPVESFRHVGTPDAYEEAKKIMAVVL